MYEVLVNDNALYYPGNATYAIYDTNLSQEIGLAGEFEFTVPAENPQYGTLENGAIITILKDNAEYWRGEVRNIEYDFNKNAKVYALEDVAWLGDEFLTPAYIDTETYVQRFQTVLGVYNSTRPADRQFNIGYITNVTSADICTWQTEYEESILDDIRKCICKDSGYIRVRRVTSGGVVIRYIDILKIADYGKLCNQPIQFAYNLLEYAQEFDLGNITNVLTPYGDELETEIYEGVNARLEGTTITNNSSISVYGRHAKAVVFDGVTALAELDTLAAAYLTRYSQPELTLEVTAIDLSEIDNWQSIDIGDSIRVVAEPFNIDQWLYVTEFDTDLQNVDRNKITLSGTVRRDRTLTSQTAGTAEAVKNIPSKSSILEAAKRNALAMLLDETQDGHVVFEYDSNNEYMVAINICNAPTIAASTKRWRWSENGFGYMKRDYPGDETTNPWTELPIAITMNGEIVANAITAGTLTGIEINNGNGTFYVDSNGNMTASSGTFSGSLSGATGSFSGSLNAASGTFKGSLQAASGTLTDGTGTLYLSGGSLYMENAGSGGAGVFAYQTGGALYACWGANNSSSRRSGNYIETATWNVIQAGINASDERLKENIKDIDSDFATDLILGIKPKTFNFKKNKGLPSELQFGVIAQDIKEIEEKHGITEDNRLCYTEDDGFYAVEYRQLIAPMIKVIQEQQSQINNLMADVNKMKGEKQNG